MDPLAPLGGARLKVRREMRACVCVCVCVSLCGSLRLLGVCADKSGHIQVPARLLRLT
jgi:hypothetical protein